jgi:phosphohistidine swiveling domain-containing protein
MILRLGSGEAAAWGCGTKAALLDRASREGLPVPSGVIVPHEAFSEALGQGLARVVGLGGPRSLVVPAPAALVAFLGLDTLSGRLAVRSAFSAEDRERESLAGLFASGLFVDGRAPAAVAAALAGVWASAFRRPGRFRRDVIVQAMVDAGQAGIAFTELEFEDDLVNATEGTAERLVAGQVTGESFLLPKIRPGEGATETDETRARLQILLRGVRRVFGEGDWDVEWADDGRATWLVQVRPVTRPTRRNEVFTFANQREILPDPPSPFMTSLIAACAGGLFAYYRRFDRALPARRPFIEVFRGRPFINFSLLSDMMRRWGLPTRLVTDSIGGEAERDFGPKPLRLLKSLPVLARLGLAQLEAVASARRRARDILARTESPPGHLTDAVDVLTWLYPALVTEMFSLTVAMSAPLAILRRFGVLAEVAGRWRSDATEMREGLAALHARAASSPELRPALERGELPDDAGLRRAFSDWIARFGHRGVYESDIARPRYREAQAPLLRSLASRSAPPHHARPWSARAVLLLPVAWQAARALRAREQLLSTAMVGFERVRGALLARARALAGAGALPEPEAVFALTVDEARRLESGLRPDPAFWAERRREIESLRAYDFPDLFHRFDDLEAFRAHRESEPPPVRLRGIALTTGRQRGRAWVITEPSVEPPPGWRPEETILVARAVDAGWIPTFALVGGVVIETGGDLSHGSIVLRELGLPAVTNVRGASHALRTGDHLLLSADDGLVVRLEASS